MMVHATITGEGPDLVLLHGWGMNSGCWGGLGERLSRCFRVHRIDLPGHGCSTAVRLDPDLDALARSLAEEIPAGTTVAGWSLGALVALHLAARAAEHVSRLVLIAATPRFTRTADWTAGLGAARLAAFACGLDQDPERAVREFGALMVRGEDHPLKTLRELRRRLAPHGAADPAALATGLAILCSSDLRPALGRIEQPTLVLHGTGDAVVPPSAGQQLAAALGNARFELIGHAGHAPFVAHEDAVRTAIERFLGARCAVPTDGIACR